MKISVTEEDIDNGFFRDARNCPVALALKRGFGVSSVEVSEDMLHIRGVRAETRICSVRVETPERVRRFIWEYDRYWDVEPFEFELGTLFEGEKS